MPVRGKSNFVKMMQQKPQGRAGQFVNGLAAKGVRTAAGKANSRMVRLGLDLFKRKK